MNKLEIISFRKEKGRITAIYKNRSSKGSFIVEGFRSKNPEGSFIVDGFRSKNPKNLKFRGFKQPCNLPF